MKTDFKNVRVEVQNGVAVLFMNNPPVNQLSEHFVKELVEAISSGFQDSDIKGNRADWNRKEFHSRRGPHGNL